MRYLSLSEILELHERILSSFGGATGIRDIAALELAVNQPHAGFGDKELNPDLISKAGSLCFSLIMNHPFIDGNKRVGHAAMETFLVLNGRELKTPADEQERVILSIAKGNLNRDDFIEWLRKNTTKRLE